MTLNMSQAVWMFLVLLVASRGPAQDAARPADLPATPAQTPADIPISPQDEALVHYDRWAAQQEVYSPAMIADMRQRLCDRLAALTPSDQPKLRNEILVRLSVFQEPLAQDAMEWVLQTLAVATDSYASTVRARLPDIVTDDADQIRKRFRALAIRRQDMQRYHAGFDQTRQATVAVLQNNAQNQAAINSHLRSSMTFSSPNLYTPGAHRVDVSARYQGYFNQRYANPYAFGGIWFF